MVMRIIRLIIVFSLFSTLDSLSQTRNSTRATISGEFIYPYQSEHVHGSSIVSLPNGDLLAAWFQGSGERTG
jgi:hypothetical protein